jgi:UrcA family protein
MNRFTTTIAILALTLGYQVASADPAGEFHAIDVHFADLNLTRTEGVAILYQRIESAAQTVCTSLDGRDLGSAMRFRGCVQKAMATAVAKVDRPALTAYYRAKSGTRNATVQLAQK